MSRERDIGIEVFQMEAEIRGEVSDIRLLPELEAENARLKKMYAELALVNTALEDLIEKKGWR